MGPLGPRSSTARNATTQIIVHCSEPPVYTMMKYYTGHGAEKMDQVSQAEGDGEQNAEVEEALTELDLEGAENENGEPVQATAGGFSTKKFSVLLGAITFMWYYLSMVMWW